MSFRYAIALSLRVGVLGRALKISERHRILGGDEKTMLTHYFCVVWIFSDPVDDRK